MYSRSLAFICLLVVGCVEADDGVEVIDVDQDGVEDKLDCDDSDAGLGAVSADSDCDGVLTADDCDDNDEASTTRATDADCDGVLTADDCDDNDEASTTRATDADCDGVLTADDCDDNDATLGDIALDADCNGIIDPSWPAVNDLSIAADYAFVGEAIDDYSGISVSSAGDVDGDDLADLLVGASGNDEGGDYAGKTYLILGASLGASGTIDLSAADYAFIGEAGGDKSGRSVSSAGDVDGDGLDDLLVGAYGRDERGSSAGKTYLILGASLGANPTIDLSAADYAFIGEAAGDNSGSSVSSAGDVDGDGLDDLLVGAYFNDEGGNAAGKTYLILGASLGASPTINLSAADYAFVGESAGDCSGYSVSSAGDVDGDGLDDILVGAYSEGGPDAGMTYLILGASLDSNSTIDLSAADYAFDGEAPNDRSGRSVSSAGDVDGDGLDDLLVGASGNGEGGLDAGKTYLILGSSLGASGTINLSAADYAFVGEAASDVSGASVSSAGDVDGDGLADLLVGAYGNDEGGTHAGKTYFISGVSLGASPTIDLSAADYAFVGEAALDASGTSVSSAGDVNGDGLDDILVGANANDEGGNAAGKTYLIFSAFTPPTP